MQRCQSANPTKSRWVTLRVTELATCEGMVHEQRLKSKVRVSPGHQPIILFLFRHLHLFWGDLEGLEGTPVTCVGRADRAKPLSRSGVPLCAKLRTACRPAHVWVTERVTLLLYMD